MTDPETAKERDKFMQHIIDSSNPVLRKIAEDYKRTIEEGLLVSEDDDQDR